MRSNKATSMSSLQAVITQKQTIEGILSASGMEIVDEYIYIIGDDSLFLSVLTKQWELTKKIPLLSGELATGRIPKKQKPDFEMMTHFIYEGESMLLVAGSGSQSPERDTCFLLHLRDHVLTGPYSLKEVYDPLRVREDVVSLGKLNLEGLAADANRLFFLQRGNITGNNVLISYDLRSFCQWLLQRTIDLPKPTVERYELLALLDIRSGFSGATMVPNTTQLLFTASVENTANEIDDGETLGSFVGLIDVSPSPSTLLSCALLTENGQPYRGKVESIAIISASDKIIKAIAVTDNDLGDSDILALTLSW